MSDTVGQPRSLWMEDENSVCMGGGGVIGQGKPSPNGSLHRNTKEVGIIHACLISPLLLLRRLVSFCAFSNGAYLHSAPSPTALNFTTCLLL
jgi:hypothetical protein